ncbi:nucleotidyl transferase AbiEii/AbiGii toxin family protein [Saccharibacillus sp. CPCC 101409]|uniref:nucleotidyl transferase AbiEii/AbiGii toxin family protein n=1 Tax=Saccharibacillus sp. CPCC 101409 TaxID=3058041 RepID=UPI0026716D90|nr:nucleotidyl transferase AbiEii/AbiGii toxin family protein [Saccharibacillus sp. CPCC 101409]MDO3409439.1 nucleotidyl transferase AbiEii/AbiGii toxin family protein [Saccharibacillus sp. CPCC 101409]
MNIFSSSPYSLQQVLRDFVKAVNAAGFSDRIVLKGGLNLEAAVQKYNANLVARPTVDADFHISKKESWEQFLDEVPKKISQSSQLGLSYSLKSRRGFDRFPGSDTVTLTSSQNHQFDVDMNISSFSGKTEIYVGGYLPGFTIPTMLADKVAVFLSTRIYRRSKDLYDLYLFSYLMDYAMNVLLPEIQEKLAVGKGIEIPYHIADPVKLEHAYSKLSGIPNKPSFETVCARVITFVYPIAGQLNQAEISAAYWNPIQGEWVEKWS